MAKRILIVEDEMDAGLVLEKSLTVEGYSVITAYNGNRALTLARLERFDLIILDRVLGDMYGEEVATRLKEDSKTKDIPIIFLSALFSKTEELKQDNTSDGNAMFAKPYDIEKLLIAIENLLSEKKKISVE